MEATEREVVYLILLFTKDTFTMLDFRYFRNLGALAVAAMAYAAAPTTAKAGPVTYDAVTDFNTTGAQISASSWTYGTETALNGTFTLLPQFAAITCYTLGVADACSPSDASFDSYYYSGNGAGGPDIADNLSGGTITYPVSPAALVWPDNVLELGPGGSSGGPEFTVLRWTAQQTGTYSISGFTENLQYSTTDQYVFIGDVEAYSQTFDGSADLQQDPLSFSDLSLAAGETVDFIVGPQGNQNGDVIGLSATITSGEMSAPEPASSIMILLGTCTLAGLTSKKRPRQERL